MYYIKDEVNMFLLFLRIINGNLFYIDIMLIYINNQDFIECSWYNMKWGIQKFTVFKYIGAYFVSF